MENVLATVGRYYLKQMKGSNAGDNSEIQKHFMLSDLHAWLILTSHFNFFPLHSDLRLILHLKSRKQILKFLFFNRDEYLHEQDRNSNNISVS